MGNNILRYWRTQVQITKVEIIFRVPASQQLLLIVDTENE